MIFRLMRRQEIVAPIEEVWRFFSQPQNLNRLTPPDLSFRILGALPDVMHQGQLIEYRVQFIKGIWTRWLTEIRHVETERYFVDEQRIGPYQLWYHEHVFRARGGSVLMEDRVTYVVGYGPLGAVLNSLWVARRLNRIFDYRAQQIDAIFAPEHTTGDLADDKKSRIV